MTTTWMVSQVVQGGSALLLGASAVISAHAGWAAPSPVEIVPATRVENIESEPNGLADQTFQNVTFKKPLTTTLITVADRSGTNVKRFLVVARVAGGGTVSFNVKENQQDVVLQLTQPITLTGLSIRCDSHSSVVCRYSISLVGR